MSTQPIESSDQINLHLPIPYGYCECGCGQKTKIAKYDRPNRGHVKGKPIRFIAGHVDTRGWDARDGPNPSGLCLCGCGQKTALAKQSSSRRGHVRGKPIQYVQGHNAKRPVEERFWEKVDKHGPDDCWLWTGAKDWQNRGILRNGNIFGELKTGATTASRVSWELHYGPIPDGMNVCHNCPGGDNPQCVNPSHLWLGTQSDNVRDMVKKHSK